MSLATELKPYPQYRDSGSSWVGSVPESWVVKRAKHVLSHSRDVSDQGTEQLLSVSQYTGVTPRGRSDEEPQGSLAGYRMVHKGELVVNIMLAWNGSLGVSSYEGIVSPAYAVFALRSGEPRYVHYLLRTPAAKTRIKASSRGVVESRLRLYPDDLLRMEMPVPPREDQAAIVRYLDHIDSRMQRFIAAKERLIELLEEEKRAIIHRAVTRGLYPVVPLKPSGVDWLGDVPAPWEVAPLGRCLRRIDQGWSPVAAEEDLTDRHWAVLTLSAIRQGVFAGDAVKPVPLDATVPSRLGLRNGDLLITRSNTRDRVGDACVVEDVRPKTLMSDLIYRLAPRASVDPQFLMYQLLSGLGRTQIERDARGSSGTMPKLSQRHIRAWRVLLPPREEQLRIAAVLRTATRRVDEVVDRAREEISLVREYRTRLISDVVTGKLDVREASSKGSVSGPEAELEQLGAMA